MSIPNMVLKRLDRRRVAGFALASLAVTLLGTLRPTSAYRGEATALTPPPEINHQAISCWPRDEFLELQVSFQPPEEVLKASVHFHWDRNAFLYFVEFAVDAQGRGRAVLPKTGPNMTGAVYFIELLTPSYVAVRGEEIRVPVKDAAECRQDPAVAVYSGEQPNITVGATNLTATPVPPGYQDVGIQYFVDSSGAVTSAAGGGSGKTLAFVGVGAGVGAGLAVLDCTYLFSGKLVGSRVNSAWIAPVVAGSNVGIKTFPTPGPRSAMIQPPMLR